MENSWALEKLILIIRENEKIIQNMSKEICKLRLIECNNSNIFNIINEFKNK